MDKVKCDGVGDNDGFFELVKPFEDLNRESKEGNIVRENTESEDDYLDFNNEEPDEEKQTADFARYG